MAMFQHICNMTVTAEDWRLAQRATREKDVVRGEDDLILSETKTWAGHTVELRLRPRPGNTALLTAAVWTGVEKGNAKCIGYCDSEKCCQSISFDIGDINFLVCVMLP